MTGSEYQILAARTIDVSNRTDMLVEAAMGLAGESGECVDIVKKMQFQSHTLDADHLVEELGDVLWYIAEAATAIGCDLDYIMQANIEKLKKRYPEGFDPKRSIYRDVSMEEALK